MCYATIMPYNASYSQFSLFHSRKRVYARKHGILTQHARTHLHMHCMHTSVRAYDISVEHKCGVMVKTLDVCNINETDETDTHTVTVRHNVALFFVL